MYVAGGPERRQTEAEAGGPGFFRFLSSSSSSFVLSHAPFFGAVSFTTAASGTGERLPRSFARFECLPPLSLVESAGKLRCASLSSLSYNCPMTTPNSVRGWQPSTER